MNTKLLRLAAVAIALIAGSSQAATVVVDTQNGDYGDTDGFAIDFNAGNTALAAWTPALVAGETYSIDSVSVYENNAISTEFYLGVYTGLTTGNVLSGFEGTSSNTVNFSATTGINVVTWNFTGINVVPEENAGTGGDIRYFVLQTGTTALTEVPDLGVNAIRRNSSSFSNMLSVILNASAGNPFIANRNPAYQATLSVVPEPSSLALALIAGLGLLMFRKRR